MWLAADECRPNIVAYLFKAIFNPEIHIPKRQFSSAVYVFVIGSCELRISQLALREGLHGVTERCDVGLLGSAFF